ncbi:hypothetical protein BGW36DRAFT_400345 [Talaromyces proteolyticus]|uniref:Aminoglycoside phosphotransferase domain-containing protein n=1 Tax=Talaromyces proteolyticus TaxID=1131652 RepID=A0AAD4PSZ7_9EURO|nr:uncharacterized protein BGW36DRAFT_400345 [Talaromyces proteolyticus]KAH8692306.1 hypothetical protein BGW36DRAFT_400345 [Talaromyces proteolyticus]
MVLFHCFRPDFMWPDRVQPAFSDQLPLTSSPTHPQEVLTMQVAIKTGLPVPRVICYGEHPDTPHAPVSILMTRVPGRGLGQAYESLTDEDRNLVLQEIYSLMGTPIRSVRVPNHSLGPFETEKELNEYLIEPAWAAYHDALDRARVMERLPHRILFTHGDLQHHNILEFTTSVKVTREDFWWYGFVELDCDRALFSLTSAVYYW